MATVGEIRVTDKAISKYVSASEDFSGYASGLTTIATLEWDGPRVLRAIAISGDEATAMANGTNSEFFIEAKTSPTGSNWMGFARLTMNNTEVTATNFGGLLGFTYAEVGNLNLRGEMVALPWSDADNLTHPLVAYGVRLRVNVDAADTTIAGVIENLWLSAIFE